MVGYDPFVGTLQAKLMLRPTAILILVVFSTRTYGALETPIRTLVGQSGRRIAQYEVTNHQYVDFLNQVDPQGTNELALYSPNMSGTVGLDRGGIAYSPSEIAGRKYATRPGREQWPVVWVSWFDAARFVNWLNTGDTERGAYDLVAGTPHIRHLVSDTGWTWTLPTRDEWVGAAILLPPRANDYREPLPVGSYLPNIYGLFDLEGNAAEWLEDEWPDLQGYHPYIGGSMLGTPYDSTTLVFLLSHLDASAVGIRPYLFPVPGWNWPCDAYPDSSFDAADAGIMFGAVVGTGENRSQNLGDCNQDGLIDAADFGILFQIWTGDGQPVAVPEPTTRLFFMMCTMLLAARRSLSQ